MDLCVLICTHNREELLKRTLASLGSASRPEGMSVEVLVVANACSDGSVGWLRSLRGRVPGGSEFPLRWAEEQRVGKTIALNRGISSTEAAVVAFVDDDHRVDPSYLTGIRAAVSDHPEASLFCGRIHPDWDGTEPSWVRDSGPYRIYPLPVPRFDQGEEPHEIRLGGAVPGGGNLFLRREVFERVGRFSEDLGPRGHNLAGGEDGEFVVRALRAGERLRYAPGVLQYHYVDRERFKLAYLLRKSYERSRASVLVTDSDVHGIQPYVFRKLLQYVAGVVFSANWGKRRFYLVRMAATAGEIAGMRRSALMRTEARR